MPNYVYFCPACDEEWEKFNSVKDRHKGGKCKRCGKRGKIAITGFSNLTFRKRWFEGIASEPVYVESQAQLDRICKENKCYVEKDDRKKQRAYYEKHGMVGEGKRVCSR